MIAPEATTRSTRLLRHYLERAVARSRAQRALFCRRMESSRPPAAAPRVVRLAATTTQVAAQ